MWKGCRSENQKQVVEERVDTSTSVFIAGGSKSRNSSRAGTRRKERSHEEMLLTDLSSWLAQPPFIYFFNSTQDQQLRDSITYNGLGPSVPIQKMSYRLAYILVLQRHSLSWSFLLSVDCRWYQVDVKIRQEPRYSWKQTSSQGTFR